MENTLANKARFFGLYFGAEVEGDPQDSDDYKICTWELTIDGFEFAVYEGCTLLLKPLSSISDEDAKELSLRLGTVVGLDEIIHKNSPDLVKEVVENYSSINSLWMLPARFVDKARELGYAIDWNNLSIEKQIAYGWIKLKD